MWNTITVQPHSAKPRSPFPNAQIRRWCFISARPNYSLLLNYRSVLVWEVYPLPRFPRNGNTRYMCSRVEKKTSVAFCSRVGHWSFTIRRRRSEEKRLPLETIGRRRPLCLLMAYCYPQPDHPLQLPHEFDPGTNYPRIFPIITLPLKLPRSRVPVCDFAIFWR